MKNRNHAFDLLCALCILRMICLHVLQMCGHAHDEWWKEVMAWTYFFMAFFFFKSGFFNKGNGGDTLSYCKEKARRLIIPYLASGLIGDAIYFAFLPPLMEKYHAPIEPLEWQMVWTRSSFFGNPPVWFLFSFFCAYVGIHLLEKVRHLHWVAVLFPLASYWLFRMDNPLWMGVENVFMGIYFFYLGKMWRRATVRLDRDTLLWTSVALTVAFAIVNLCLPGQYAMSSNSFTGNPWGGVAGTTLALCGLSGVLMGTQVPRIPALSFIGEHSMVYFIAHYPILYFVKFTHLCFGRSIYGRYEEAIVLIPTLLIVCTWLVPFVERTPWLSGRWPNPKKRLCTETLTDLTLKS